MGGDPEELLRSIERTREELAKTVDTIAGRLDPRVVAKRGVDKLREVPKPAIGGGLAALLALAAILYAANRRQRH